MLQKSFLSFSILAALASAAQAQDAALQPAIEVTASRVTETVDASLADVSVITRNDIERSGAPDLIELLRLEAGIDVARAGGAGEQTSVFMRGTNSNHVLVLIDGVRVASSNTGAFAFENLPLDAVERVEIVRGPRASYWGSDAIGGVIQIFTRRLDSAEVAAGYGSYRSADGSVGYGMQSDAGGFSAMVGARHVGGFSATNPGICNGPNDPYCIFNPDDNGFQNHNVVAAGDYKLGAQTLSASIFRSEGTQNFDNGASDGISHTLDQAIGVNLEGALSDTWQDRLNIGSSREDLNTPAFESAYRSTREQLAWTNDFALSQTQHIIAGFDTVHERGISIDTSGFGAPYDVARNNDGVFAGWRAQDGAFDSEIAGRYDHNSDFGSAFSGSAAAGWKLGDDWRLSASYGTAFRAPSLSELFSPGYGGEFAGNPALDPEHSRTLEFGVDWRPDTANSVGAHAYSTRVHDLIDFSGGTTFQAINIDRAAIDGIEIVQGWHGSDWSLDDNVTVQNPRDVDTGAQLVRRPKQKLTSVLERRMGDHARVGVEFMASGHRQDVSDYTLPGYAIVSVRASYVLAPTWRVSLRLENLFDRDYELAHGYNTPGRSGFVEIAWQPH